MSMNAVAVVVMAFISGLFLLNAILSWLDRRGGLFLDLARVQWEERVQLREKMDRELSGQDAQDCINRVKRRMLEGDSVWLPPMYNRVEAFCMWRRKHRSHTRVTRIEDRREA